MHQRQQLQTKHNKKKALKTHSKPRTKLTRQKFSTIQTLLFAVLFGAFGGFLIIHSFADQVSFGSNIPAAPAFPVNLPEVTVTNWAGLQSAVASGNIRIKVVGKINIGDDWRWTKPNVWVYGDPNGGAALVGGAIKINTSDIWVSNIEIYGGPYNGLKLGDGAPASRIVIADNYIHDVADQGILVAADGAKDVWIMRSKIEKVNLTDNPDVYADGHDVYLGGYGGVTKRIYILSNELHPAGYGVQAYPEPDTVVIAGNSIIGGSTRGGIVWYSGATNVTAVGNLIEDAPSAGFEVGGTGGGNRADDNVCLRCKLWATGYDIPQGSGNISTNDQAVADAFRVRSDQWGWLPSFWQDGKARTIANAGSQSIGGGPVTPTPTVSLSASPSSITSGSSSSLSWTSTNASSCTASGAWSGSKATSGSQSVSPTSTATYMLSCTGSGGSAGDSATITVTANNSPPAPVITQNIKSGDVLTGTVSWSATTSANNITSVSFDMDYNPSLSSVDNTPPFQRTLNTTQFANGSHDLGLTVTLNTGEKIWQPYQIGTVTFNNTSPQKPADLNNDGIVNITDLAMLLNKWGTADQTADINQDGIVNIFDLATLLNKWGS